MIILFILLYITTWYDPSIFGCDISTLILSVITGLVIAENILNKKKIEK